MDGNLLKIHSKKEKGVVWLTKNGALFFVQKVGSVGIGFTEKAVNHFEVYDRAQLFLELKTIFDANNFPSTEFVAVVGDDSLFAKMVEKNKASSNPLDASGQNNWPAEKPKDEENFISMVPYEEVALAEIDAGDSRLLIAANKEYLNEFRKILEELGSSMEMAIPSVVLGKDLNFSSGLNEDNCGQIIKNRKTYQKYNLLELSKKKSDVFVKPITGSNQLQDNSKKRLIILISFLVFLLTILGILIYINFK